MKALCAGQVVQPARMCSTVVHSNFYYCVPFLFFLLTWILVAMCSGTLCQYYGVCVYNTGEG